MKVNFDMHNGRIGIEGDGPELLSVLQAARELVPHITQIQITATSPSEQAQATEAERTRSQQADGGTSRQTMRQFARSLSLDNATERIAALAYYVNKVEGRSAFSPKEMDGWFTMCGFQKPTQMSVALYDAKRKYGYIENVNRGNWRISNQGENAIIAKVEKRTYNE